MLEKLEYQAAPAKENEAIRLVDKLQNQVLQGLLITTGSVAKVVGTLRPLHGLVLHIATRHLRCKMGAEALQNGWDGQLELGARKVRELLWVRDNMQKLNGKSYQERVSRGRKMELCRQDFFNIRCRMENGDEEGRTEGDGQRIHHWEIRRRGVHRRLAGKGQRGAGGKRGGRDPGDPGENAGEGGQRLERYLEQNTLCDRVQKLLQVLTAGGEMAQDKTGSDKNQVVGAAEEDGGHRDLGHG